MANTGCTDRRRPLARKFFDVFHGYDARRLPLGQLRGHGAAPLRSLSRGNARVRAAEAATFRAVRVPGRRAARRTDRRPISAQAWACIKAAMGCASCDWPAPASVWCRPYSKVRRLLESLGRDRVRRAERVGRMLRLRRHVCRQRRGRVVHDGRRPLARSSASRHRSAHRQRHVVPDAPGRA